MELELHSYLLKLLIYHFYEVVATPWHELISCAFRFWSRCHSFGNVGRVISIGFPESGVAFRRAQQMSGANASSIESRNPNEQTHMEEKKKRIANSVYMLFLHFIFLFDFFCFSYIYFFFSIFFLFCFILFLLHLFRFLFSFVIYEHSFVSCCCCCGLL